MVPDQLSELDLNLCVNVLSRALFPICARVLQPLQYIMCYKLLHVLAVYTFYSVYTEACYEPRGRSFRYWPHRTKPHVNEDDEKHRVRGT